jgi:hypothetical protein
MSSRPLSARAGIGACIHLAKRSTNDGRPAALRASMKLCPERTSGGAGGYGVPHGLGSPRALCTACSNTRGPDGGQGGEREWQQDLWIWPLPPTGPLTFAIEWRTRQIPLTTHEVDADIIREAAERAQALFA